MRKVMCFVLLMAVLLSTGCFPLIGPIATSAVLLDRHICKKKGIKPPALNPTLEKMVKPEKKDK
jgi:hypothetical protein